MFSFFSTTTCITMQKFDPLYSLIPSCKIQSCVPWGAGVEQIFKNGATGISGYINGWSVGADLPLPLVTLVLRHGIKQSQEHAGIVLCLFAGEAGRRLQRPGSTRSQYSEGRNNLISAGMCRNDESSERKRFV